MDVAGGSHANIATTLTPIASTKKPEPRTSIAWDMPNLRKCMKNAAMKGKQNNIPDSTAKTRNVALSGNLAHARERIDGIVAMETHATFLLFCFSTSDMPRPTIANAMMDATMTISAILSGLRAPKSLCGGA